MADYLLPSAADLPHFTTARTETPATTNPLGVKGVGEAGTIASTPAVVNAIIDALRPFGIRDVVMPCTPERIWRALKTARDSGPGTQVTGDSATEAHGAVGHVSGDDAAQAHGGAE
jgi:carbon-monoxide dehydrogenase large subunit